MANAFKRPESVLVVIYTATSDVLLMKRVRPVFWQSVTGALRWPNETPAEAARRELFEETGVSDGVRWHDWQHTEQFPIRPEWAKRYGPDARTNTEHLFSARLPEPVPVTLNPAEHSAFRWVSFSEAADTVWSWTNRQAIEWIQRGDPIDPMPLN